VCDEAFSVAGIGEGEVVGFGRVARDAVGDTGEVVLAVGGPAPLVGLVEGGEYFVVAGALAAHGAGEGGKRRIAHPLGDGIGSRRRAFCRW